MASISKLCSASGLSIPSRWARSRNPSFRILLDSHIARGISSWQMGWLTMDATANLFDPVGHLALVSAVSLAKDAAANLSPESPENS